MTLLPVHGRSGTIPDQQDQHALQQEAKALVKRFASELKPRLSNALQSGGPVHAITVCADQAPQIASQISIETGWQVKRVSLKARNQSGATPDDWEKQVLQSFETRRAGGEAVSSMIHSEIIDSSYRFMKPQIVEAVCLNCHGSKLQPDVTRALQQHYPNDQATGYSLGQIRGAFSLSKTLGD
jgi:hypothetical protein